MTTGISKIFLLLGSASSNCQVYRKNGYKETSVFSIQVPGMPAFNVRCDMETDGGGWIVFQRRVDGSVNFYRNWSEYKNGFGDLKGNFWLGLEKIHKLAGPGKGAILRVDLKHMSMPTVMKYACYRTFEVSDEGTEYKLKVGGYFGNAGDSLGYQNGMPFSTKDYSPGRGCASSHKGAWWYNVCHESNLNGLYPYLGSPAEPKYMGWLSLKFDYGGIFFSEMKIRYLSP